MEGLGLPTWDSPTLQGLDLEAGAGGFQMKKSNRQAVKFRMVRSLEMCAALGRNDLGVVKILKYDAKPVERLFVRIETPGDKNIFDDVANEYHKKEYYRHYKAFKDGKGAPEGHSIDDCEYIQPQIAIELRYFGIHTMEQLADAPDSVLDRLPEGRQYAHYAQQWCQINSPTGIQAVTKQLSAELSAAKAEIEKLRSEGQKTAREVTRLQGQVLDTDGNPVFSNPITDGVALPGAMEVEERSDSATLEISPEEFKAKRNKGK